MKQLERLLFLQGNLCFFCRHAIPSGEASVEHLVATSKGGSNDDENCAACCKALNQLFNNMSVKSKLRAVLNQRGAFVCPRKGSTTSKVVCPSEPPSTQPDHLTVVVEDLRKRGTTRPRRIATLKNALKSIAKLKLSDHDIESVVAALVSKGYITVQNTKDAYSLPALGE